MTETCENKKKKVGYTKKKEIENRRNAMTRT